MPRHSGSQKICIIDRDLEVLTKLSPMLANRGFTTCGYSTVSQFLDQEKILNKVCFLLLDISANQESGLELLEDMKKNKIYIPTIATVSESDVPRAVDAMKQNVIDVLEKPLVYQLVVKRITGIVKVYSPHSVFHHHV